MKVELVDLIDQFLKKRRDDFTPATRASYGLHLRLLADYLIENGWDFTDLNEDRIQDYFDFRGWASNTRRLSGNATKSFLRWKYGPAHPLVHFRLPRDNARPGRYLNEDQVEILFKALDPHSAAGWRDRAMLGLMIETGLRVSEICRLETRYVDLVRRHLVVLAKGRKWREGVFSEGVAKNLETWMQIRKTVAVEGCPFLFVSVGGMKPGHGLTREGLKANIRRLGLRSGIGRLSPHDFRRTMATLLTERGAPTRLVQRLGGWGDIRMVERYTRNLKPGQIDQYTPLKRRQPRQPGQD
jgi:integrase/recombinase XerD